MDKGIYTVLVTPFTSDNSIDYFSYDKLMDHVNNSPVEGVVVLGTTSESPTLNITEKEDLVKKVWQKFSGNKKVVIGVGGNNTSETLNFADNVKDYCDYMMVTVPYYNKPSQEGIKMHFETICNSDNLKDKKFMLYNIPSRCGVNMSPDTVAYLYNNFSNIVAIKEASGSLTQVMDIKSKCDIQIFAGDDSQILPIMTLGGSGVISVIGNICPNKIHEIYSLFELNEIILARKKFYKLYELMKVLFIETNPVPTKELLKYMNIFSRSDPRLPLVNIINENLSELINTFDKYVIEEKNLI